MSYVVFRLCRSSNRAAAAALYASRSLRALLSTIKATRSGGTRDKMKSPTCLIGSVVNYINVKINAAVVVILLFGSGCFCFADRASAVKKFLGDDSFTISELNSDASKSSSSSKSKVEWKSKSISSLEEEQISNGWRVATRTMKQRLPKTDRIVGGTPAVIDTYQNGFMVALYYAADRFVCGGSLITPTVVLTAAHCAPYVAFVRTHINNKYGTEQEEGYEQFDVVEVITHPQYNSTLKRMDYALLKLNGWSTLGTIIALNNISNVPSVQDQVTVMGWGTTSEGGLDSPTLLKATLNYIPFEQCWEAYNRKNIITTANICAGVEQGGKDACQGDSGGPLILGTDTSTDKIDGSASSKILLGVVSFGYGCARPGIPGVYQRVSSAVDWIKNTACKLHNKKNSYNFDSSNNCPVQIVTEYPKAQTLTANPEKNDDKNRNSGKNAATSFSTAAPQATKEPTQLPAAHPTATPRTAKPMSKPVTPTEEPTKSPTALTEKRTKYPVDPTEPPKTAKPTDSPVDPTARPRTAKPKKLPSSDPSSAPSSTPTATELPSTNPSKRPSTMPSTTARPSTNPSQRPSSKPTRRPSNKPSLKPSSKPSGNPSINPSTKPSSKPTVKPSIKPSTKPSSKPTMKPSIKPSTKPSSKPTVKPSKNPSHKPSLKPSEKPTEKPSSEPSDKPSSNPMLTLVNNPSRKPSSRPNP